VKFFEEWKMNTKAYLIENQDSRLSIDQSIKVDLDSAVLQEFLKTNLFRIPDNATKREFEDMIGFFMEKTARREYSIQQSSGGIFSLNKDIEAKATERSSLEKKLFEEDNDYHIVKEELRKTILQEKAREKLIEERRHELEFNILKHGEENFEQYLNGNSEVFTTVKKTYGAKISQKMKAEQKEEFIELVKKQYQNRKEDISAIHFKILGIDKQLDECDRQIQ
jgi:hypothetical protein